VIRTAVALVPLMLASVTPALAQSHAGHASTVQPAQAALLPPGCVRRGAPTADAARVGTAGAPVCPTGAAPERLPATDPHARHDMSAMGQAKPSSAPMAGHDMSTMMPAPAGPAAQVDPHAGHDMSTMGQAAPSSAPMAGHDMSAMTPAPAAPATPANPHASHDMSAMGQTPSSGAMPSGHDMSTMAMPPDVPTSADTPGRMPEMPTPAGATIGPTHAADTLFDPAEMAAAREQLRVENGDVRSSLVLIDRLETSFGDGSEAYSWDAQGWVGGDINRFWWKSEGGGDFGGRLEDVEVQALYSHAFAPFFDFQTGVRQTYRPEGDRTDLVVGVQGLAPYWFEVDGALFLSNKGELTARAQAEYDQRITQRWILQPRVEVSLSAEDIPELSVGSGLSSVQLGARLRYEFKKEFAPYVGVEWTRRFGNTRDFLQTQGRSAEDTRFVVGIRAWF
jgi:copper resistance protein B